MPSTATCLQSLKFMSIVLIILKEKQSDRWCALDKQYVPPNIESVETVFIYIAVATLLTILTSITGVFTKGELKNNQS